MTTAAIGVANVRREELRRRVSEKYRDVALNPELGFHFHTGRPLTRMLGYASDVVERLPAPTVDSFAGTGNPFLFGDLAPGEVVADVGCGAGLDTLIAALQVGPTGRVIAVDMTPEMRAKAKTGAGAGPHQRRGARGVCRAVAHCGRQRRCRYQQRCHQPLPGQAGGVP